MAAGLKSFFHFGLDSGFPLPVTLAAVSQCLILQGRRLDGPELERLGQWVGEHPDWSRWRLSRELAAHWEWRNGAGVLKDMAARTLLVKLHQRGWIALPARRQVPTNRMRCGAGQALCLSEPPQSLAGRLDQLAPLSLQEVSGQPAQRAWVKAALGQFHYLGFGGVVGENLQYMIRCQDRDRFIGWSAPQRQTHLGLVANNTRFLILPWVEVPQLGSWILGQVARRIGADWQAKYGHGLALLETFVERDRFAGTVYRAANWIKVGASAGRTRQDRHRGLHVSVKDIYLYALGRNFRQRLHA